MTTNIPESTPGHGESINGSRDDLDPLLEAELVVDDGTAHLGLGAKPRRPEADPAPAADADADGGEDGIGDRFDAG